MLMKVDQSETPPSTPLEHYKLQRAGTIPVYDKESGELLGLWGRFRGDHVEGETHLVQYDRLPRLPYDKPADPPQTTTPIRRMHLHCGWNIKHTPQGGLAFRQPFYEVYSWEWKDFVDAKGDADVHNWDQLYACASLLGIE